MHVYLHMFFKIMYDTPILTFIPKEPLLYITPRYANGRSNYTSPISRSVLLCT